MNPDQNPVPARSGLAVVMSPQGVSIANAPPAAAPQAPDPDMPALSGAAVQGGSYSFDPATGQTTLIVRAGSGADAATPTPIPQE